MGWTFGYRERGMSDKAFFSREWGAEILDTSRAGGPGGGVIFAAIKSSRTGRVFAAIIHFRYNHRDPEFNFGWKEYDESCGCYDNRCPDRILDLLSPTDNQDALEWRAACRKRNREKIALHAGDIIETKYPIQFSSGATQQRFKVVDARRLRFTDPGASYARYKMRRACLEGARIIERAA